MKWPTWFLIAATRVNYTLRRLRLAEDKWFWADVLLIERGILLNERKRAHL